jgi:hypothetical protein
MARVLRGGFRRFVAAQAFVLGILALLAVLHPRASEARLQPYYILRTATGAATVRPRILFVLDTSGSMALRSQSTAQLCTWSECEDPAFQGTANESRIAAARRAVHNVVTNLGDDAKFALMTFEQNGAHGNTVPGTCNFITARPGITSNCCDIRLDEAGCDNGTCQSTVCGYDPWCCSTNWDSICVEEAESDCNSICDYQSTRFAWAIEYSYGGGSWAYINDAYPGEIGTWHLCQGTRTRPYPYLRWDELGAGSVIVADDQAGAIPASPLIDVDQIRDSDNARRRVQWFDEFMGVRFHPDDTTDPGRVITHGSVGDYAADAGTADAQVWEQDFYYWPYVDGFPGYAQNTMWPNWGGENTGGVASQDNNINEGKLYAPFYLDLSSTPVNPNYWGPTDEAVAAAKVLAHSNTMVDGGVDAGGGTPWSSTIGPIPAAPSQSNSIFSHTTVGSYLSFVTNIESPDVCAPTAAVLITDGDPSPSNEGGAGLYGRLADLRTDLNVEVYVVGFYLGAGSQLNNMACAAAGACNGATCDSPCDDTPADAWDTCSNPSDPAGECAFLANSSDELEAVLTQIVNQIGDFDVPSGPGSALNEFGIGAGGEPGQGEPLQTELSARTEFPTWRGHVVRQMCDDLDPITSLPAAHCVPPSPEFEDEEVEEPFGPCVQSRVWDAGECLQQTACGDRRLYTNTIDNDVIPINAGEEATAQFLAELQAQSLIPGADPQAEADAVVRFLLGCDQPDGWKLPGLANSAPVIARRIPPYRPEFTPSVAIRDPHCGGRLLSASDGVPFSLEEFADEQNDPDNRLPNPSLHYEYQEAVLIGDDMGVLHAFQLNSGNELFGFVPRPALDILAQQSANGAAFFGQPDDLEDHIYGLAATVNQAWVFDEPADKWRHVAIIGMGAGGTHLTALDVSHMSPASSQGQLEVLWTTESPANAADAASYAQYNGETWARPAIIYHVENEDAAQEPGPDAFVVFGTGYQPGSGGDPETYDPDLVQGRVLVRAEALTGNIVETATLPPVTQSMFETSYGTVVDPAVGTHCLSRLWAEAQEAYIADPAGQLFRWDLGRTSAHAADSGGPWGTPNGTATPVLPFHFPACVGGPPCTVSGSNPADPFLFAPAVSSNDRIDDFFSAAPLSDLAATDAFLVALVSGSPADDSVQYDTGFTPSLYLMVDDHSADPAQGFTVPAGAPLVAPGADANYMRVAITEIERTREVVPYTGASPITETREFSRATRPVRAPRIFVSGVIDETTAAEEQPTIIDGIEVYFVEYTMYEPPSAECDPAWYEAATETWHQDPGSSYRVTFRLTSTVSAGFNFQTGASTGGAGEPDFGAGFQTGLVLESVEQLDAGGNCADGQCGPQVGTSAAQPCDLNEGASGIPSSAFALTVQQSELAGFTPVE